MVNINLFSRTAIMYPHRQIDVLAFVPDLDSTPAELSKARDLPLQRPGHGPEQDHLLHFGQAAQRRCGRFGREAELSLPAEHVLVFAIDLSPRRLGIIFVAGEIPKVLGDLLIELARVLVGIRFHCDIAIQELLAGLLPLGLRPLIASLILLLAHAVRFRLRCSKYTASKTIYQTVSIQTRSLHAPL